MIKGVDHVGVVTKDLTASLKFYCDTLGFTVNRVVDMADGGKIAFLDIPGGGSFEVIGKVPKEVWPDTEEKPGIATLHHVGFIVEDVNEAFGRLKAAPGVELLMDAPREVGAGRKVVSFHGPDGVFYHVTQVPSKKK